MRHFLLTLISFLVVMTSARSTTAQVVAGSRELGAIWFVGDSITQGSESIPNGTTPRSELYNLLVENDYSFTFTGHHDINPEGLPADNQFHYHSGISGAVIGDSLPDRTGMTEELATQLSSGRLATVPPNTVLIMLGTNDIDNGIDIENAPGRLSNYIDEIYAQTGNADLSIFVGSIPPNGRSPQRASDVIDFNSALPDIVSAQQALGRDVHFVDHFTPLNDDFDNLIRSDNLHPTAAGDAVIAQQWFNAIDSISSIPEPSSTLILSLLVFGASIRRKRRELV